MKVFISWSGDQSRAFAEALKVWLPKVIQCVKPFVSAHDIQSGAIWLKTLTSELAVTNFGLLCLNAENLTAPWVLFEAGALSKGLDNNAVTAVLFGISQNDVKQPLTIFQNNEFSEAGIWKLLVDINGLLKENAINETVLKESFTAFWPKLNEEVQRITKTIKIGEKKPVKIEEMLEEILSLCRSQARTPSYMDLSGWSRVAAMGKAVNDPMTYLYGSGLPMGQVTPTTLLTSVCAGCGKIEFDLRRCPSCNLLICVSCEKQQSAGSSCSHVKTKS